jgi:hypothetical protein
MRTFYTESDIEDIAASGVRQLEVGSGVFLTDAARERAEELGIALVMPGAPAPKAAATPAPAASAALPSKPRGCQHGPLTVKSSQQVAVAKTGGPVVDQLVETVSALKKRGG